MKLFLRSQIHEKEKAKDQEVVTVGNSAQDGVNMAVANKDEGINYGQYLQVREKKKIVKKIVKLKGDLRCIV